jgi:hypothetical protein
MFWGKQLKQAIQIVMKPWDGCKELGGIGRIRGVPFKIYICIR